MLIPTNLLFTYVPARNQEKSLHQALQRRIALSIDTRRPALVPSTLRDLS